MSVTSWSDTQIVADIPDFAGLVPGNYQFNVTTASGPSVASGLPYFTLVAGDPPAIFNSALASDPAPAAMPVPTPTPTPSITVTPTGGNATTIIANEAGPFNVGGDTYVLTASGVAQAYLGSAAETIQFIGLSQISLTEGAANTVVTADGGTNTWTAGVGTLEVNGGGGTDTYIYHQGDGRMTVDLFSAAKGDVLTIDAQLKASMTVVADGSGGTLLLFASGGGVDLKGITTNVASLIRWS
jgi:hypothetical protein